MVDSVLGVPAGAFGGFSRQPSPKKRRPSFPQGGLDWHLRRKSSSNRSSKVTAATLTFADDDDDNNDASVNGCTCPDDKKTSSLLTTDDNANDKSSKQQTCTNVNCKNYRQPKRRQLRRRSRATVVINVGGQLFETYRSTLRRLKNSVLSDDNQMRKFYRADTGDYFFDRDPMAFGSVLNYLRTGELHIPSNMCGPSLQNELTFWGIDELDIERCCWTQYNTWKTQSRSLEKLEYDRKLSTTQDSVVDKDNVGCWTRYRSRLWTFLQDPTSSRGAKIYAWVSIIFVLVSIFSFCAETHPHFRVKPEDIRQFRTLYEFLNFQKIDWSKNVTLHNMTTNGSDVRSGCSGTKKKEKDQLVPHPCLVMIDLSCLLFFSLEYFTRFLCSPSKKKFIRALQNIIDFVAIVPDYIEFLFLVFDPLGRQGMPIMDFIFILRMLRLFRIFRLIRHVPGLWILLYTLKASFNELMLMFVFLLIGMVVFASLIHFAENDNGFDNIPIGFWWSVVTMTTVGYGDMYPQTAIGYIVGSLCAVAGLLMIAFTVPIIVSNFVLYYTHVQYGLARRDRDRERMLQEEDDDVSINSARSATTKPPVKPAVDTAAIELGENISLTVTCEKDSQEKGK
ncbi:potassium voltage-gated channel protein Shaw-like isoform X1 [Haliotis rubra]|uniref:potassium voltage-gated channel protein Shaw-like isoform X1 n=1 Tax=Haliotis rubra TaxID=36100 RepID=UPI001EE4EE75|nr:potassium voltage-gated channel protein Shaw-like isoform X1 [Haliotis rubra]